MSDQVPQRGKEGYSNTQRGGNRLGSGGLNGLRPVVLTHWTRCSGVTVSLRRICWDIVRWESGVGPEVSGR